MLSVNDDGVLMCDEVRFLRHDRRKFFHGSFPVEHLTRHLRRRLAWIASVVCALALFPAPVQADNPIVQHIYTADPAPIVHYGRLYLYTGHDEDGSTTFTMREWRVWS